MRVCLAISAFRSDRQVLALLEQLEAAPKLPVEHVFIVDSQGSGAVAAHLAERRLSFVTYENAPNNLGSAGNLTRRLTLAAEHGFDFVYALNHDGELRFETIAKLAEYAASQPSGVLGAVYPLRRQAGLNGAADYSGLSMAPLPQRWAKPPPGEVFDAFWSSSNGALYSLTPTRAGVLPLAELWHGWEDLSYGWLLHKHGYRQVVLNGAEFMDEYEFVQRKVGPLAMKVADKPAWLAYYFSRNLVISATKAQVPAKIWAAVGARIGLEVGLTVLTRPNKRERLRNIARGVVDGVLGKGGKGSVP